jgi:acyl-CoA thioester hydrolase
MRRMEQAADNIGQGKVCVELPIKVKTYDTDYMGIVNNTVYVKWIDDLRTAIFDKLIPPEARIRDHNSPIIAETSVRYKKPLTLISRPVGRAWMEEVHKSRWVMRCVISVGGIVHCEGRQEGYYFNTDKMQPVRFPAEILKLFGVA